ncbi:hypothetical protein F4778DRAFT_454215 [Xylariomycetidae sp. FL2044]|nr:hypothetical protein F4778DRAFT_454215 [Xylariomycetidae sp. FL2044]
MASPVPSEVPIVQYGVENKNIPGDPGGWFLKDCGNICHWADQDRFREFTEITDSEFDYVDDSRIEEVRSFLGDITTQGVYILRPEGTNVRETDEELTIDHSICGLRVRITQLKDVSCTDKESYGRTKRAREVARASDLIMDNREPAMGRDVENLLMARRLQEGRTPDMPMRRPTGKHPAYREDRKKWAKREELRTIARAPPPHLDEFLGRIRIEDSSRTRSRRSGIATSAWSTTAPGRCAGTRIPTTFF